MFIQILLVTEWVGCHSHTAGYKVLISLLNKCMETFMSRVKGDALDHSVTLWCTVMNGAALIISVWSGADFKLPRSKTRNFSRSNRDFNGWAVISAPKNKRLLKKKKIKEGEWDHNAGFYLCCYTLNDVFTCLKTYFL